MVPPIPIRIVIRTISHFSFPSSIFERLLIPAVNAPDLFTTPTMPPITKTNVIISIESYNPSTGALKNDTIPLVIDLF